MKMHHKAAKQIHCVCFLPVSSIFCTDTMVSSAILKLRIISVHVVNFSQSVGQ